MLSASVIARSVIGVMFKAWKIRVHHMYAGYKGRFVLGAPLFFALITQYIIPLDGLRPSLQDTVAGVVQLVRHTNGLSSTDCTLTKVYTPSLF